MPTATSPSSPAAESSCPPAASVPDRAAACCECTGGVPACSVSRLLLLVVWLVAVLAVDQAFKHHAMHAWQPTATAPISYLGGVLRIQYAENPGAFLGLFGGLGPEWRFWMLTAINGVILGLVGACLVAGRPGDLWSWTALALILAGGTGNLIDRIRFDNHVIDFLIFSTGPWDVPWLGEVRTGIFNVADMAITGGFLMLLPGILRPGAQTAAKPGAPTCAA